MNVSDDTLKTSFIIATRNRPTYLVETVKSIALQTVPPQELCIVDSSDEVPGRGDIEQICADAKIELEYVHPAPRGLPRQRNIGMERTNGELVFFIDDDVILEPECHESVLRHYEDGSLGGVTVCDTNAPELPRLSVLWRRMFGSGGWWPEAKGRLRRGFFPEGISRAASPREVEFFMGWFMSFRRDAIGAERFDEALSGYAYLEDIDFSYRISRRRKLLWTPDARGEHLRASGSRLSRKQLLRMMVANHFYLHRKNMPQTLRNRFALWWAFTGLLLLNATRAIRFRSAAHVTGLTTGLIEQARGKGLIDPQEAK